MLLARNQLTRTDVQVLADAVSSTRGAKWLLVDQALIDPRNSDRVANTLGWHSTPVFVRSRLNVFGENGPQLISIPHLIEPEWGEALQKWVTVDPTGAGLSIIGTSSSLAEVSDALHYLALTTVGDDLQLHCRCADARVLSHLLPLLTTTQTAGLRRAIDTWWWWDAQGAPCSWALGHAIPPVSSSVAIAASDHLQLSDAQYAEMMDLSEPDIIFTLLMDKTSELVPEADRGDFRTLLERILRAATRYAVTQTPDRLQFVVLSLATGESFHQHPGLKAMWQRIRNQGVSLSREMEMWSDELWLDLDHGRRSAQ